MLTLSRTEEGSSCDLMKKTLRTAAAARNNGAGHAREEAAA